MHNSMKWFVKIRWLMCLKEWVLAHMLIGLLPMEGWDFVSRSGTGHSSWWACTCFSAYLFFGQGGDR
jgi:hypothetical protein